MIAAIAVVFVVYSGALSNGFVYDDNFQVELNPWIRGFENLGTVFSSSAWGFDPNRPPSNYYRPVMYLVYTAAYYAFGLKARGFHLVSLLLHTINTLLVFLLASRLFRTRGSPGSAATNLAALLASLIFATHPINSEAVVWVASVPELSFTLFYLASFHLYVLSKEAGTRRGPLVVLSAALFFLSALSKETAMTLPVLIVFYDLVTSRGGERAERAREWITRMRAYTAYVAAGLAYLALRFSALGGAAPKKAVGGGPGLGPLEYLMNTVALCAQYIKALLLPAGLSMVHIMRPVRHATDARLAASAVLITVAAVLVWRLGRRNREFFIFAALVVLPLLPTLYLLGINRTPFAERYLYLPSAGFSLMAALSALSLAGYAGRAALAGVAVLSLLPIPYALRTAARVPEWKDNSKIWESALATDPENYIAMNALGGIYLEKGSPGRGMAMISKSLAVNSSMPRPDTEALELSHLNLADMYLRMNSLEKAADEFGTALSMDPDHPVLNYNLAYTLHRLGRLDEAKPLYEKALARFTDPADQKATLANLGNIHLSKGQWAEAAARYEQALEIDPNDTEVRLSLKAARSRIRD